MEFQFERILLQVLMVLFPFVLFLVFANGKINDLKRKIIFGLMCLLSISLSLTFAIQLGEGKYLDLRYIPWYLSFIYGGNIVGIIVSLFYIIVRIFMGGLGMFPAISVMIIGCIYIYRIRKQFFSWTLKKKLIFSSTLLLIASLLLPIIGSIVMPISITSIKLSIYISYLLENVIVTWIVIYLIESQIEKTALQKEFQNAEKFNVIGQLAASVAHEIRNPMTSIRGFMQILQASTHLSRSEKDYIKICIEEVDRANSIIADYLALGKSQSNEVSKLDIIREINKAVRSLSTFATLNNVQLNFAQKLPIYLAGNSSRVQQLLINLIKNGIEASSGNGIIDLEVTADHKHVYISISDNGEGMSKESMENFGLPFYSTKEKGTGLGLMVSRQIIDEMDGNIQVNSTKGVGTVLSLTFPRIRKGV
ncbi:ATP-binding protein [Heyndrickxia vini]|uniref:histidine kinase n=1 Tax=Heyndrickxia vini TaxID=1476025 RepID=A0ABX7E0W6_9BACI|nr:ATP-binding protein [Heyndrickxia vini]QQZ08920.1 ATP-binding protein [Heyndrickxia vini]